MSTRLFAFRRTQSHDLLLASPLIAIELAGAIGLLVRVANDLRVLHALSFPNGLNVMALFALIGFALSQIYWLSPRKTPRRFSEDMLSRAVAIASANVGNCITVLPQASNSCTVQVLSSVLMFAGAAASACVMAWLGDGFRILLQVWTLVIKWPYRFVRHPL